MSKSGMDPTALKYGPIVGFCKHGNERLVSIKVRNSEFLNQLSNNQLFMDDDVPYS
jgi:hypothetical protein